MLTSRLLAMLYVHRSYFAQALTDFPLDPMRSPFAPSFLAGYRSACTLLSALREQFEMFPTQIARFWVLWTHAFSAAVCCNRSQSSLSLLTCRQTMLHSVVIRAPTTKTAQAAIGELRSAKNLFDQAERFGGRAVKFAVCRAAEFIPIGLTILWWSCSQLFVGYTPRRIIPTLMAFNAKTSSLPVDHRMRNMMNFRFLVGGHEP